MGFIRPESRANSPSRQNCVAWGRAFGPRISLDGVHPTGIASELAVSPIRRIPSPTQRGKAPLSSGTRFLRLFAAAIGAFGDRLHARHRSAREEVEERVPCERR